MAAPCTKGPTGDRFDAPYASHRSSYGTSRKAVCDRPRPVLGPVAPVGSGACTELLQDGASGCLGGGRVLAGDQVAVDDDMRVPRGIQLQTWLRWRAGGPQAAREPFPRSRPGSP